MQLSDRYLESARRFRKRIDMQTPSYPGTLGLRLGSTTGASTPLTQLARASEQMASESFLAELVPRRGFGQMWTPNVEAPWGNWTACNRGIIAPTDDQIESQILGHSAVPGRASATNLKGGSKLFAGG